MAQLRIMVELAERLVLQLEQVEPEQHLEEMVGLPLSQVVLQLHLLDLPVAVLPSLEKRDQQQEAEELVEQLLLLVVQLVEIILLPGQVEQ